AWRGRSRRGGALRLGRRGQAVRGACRAAPRAAQGGAPTLGPAHAEGRRMRRILAVHPSDELYGADRVLLQSVQVLERLGRVRVWLPDDVEYAERLLTRELSRAA